MSEVNILGIIACVDAEIERTGAEYLTPVEAAPIIERKGLLKDSQHRPGLPLRNLLRAGKIPHAYQTKGKWSRWRIPHS